MKVIAVASRKGGVAKTTTAACLADYLGRQGKKVLAIDLDPQANLSTTALAGYDKRSLGTLDFMRGSLLRDVVRKSANDTNYDFIGAGPALTRAESEFSTMPGWDKKLRKALAKAKDYDYVVLDTPPAMGLLTYNALVAADYVVICCQADIFSLDGLAELYDNIDAVRVETQNDRLDIAGVLLTKYNERLNTSKQIVEGFQRLTDTKGTRLFEAKIRNNVAVVDSQMNHKSLFDYSKSTAREDYEAFAKELLKIMHPAEAAIIIPSRVKGKPLRKPAPRKPGKKKSIR